MPSDSQLPVVAALNAICKYVLLLGIKDDNLVFVIISERSSRLSESAAG